MNKTFRTTLGFVFLFIAGFCLWQAVPASARREATMSPPVQAEFNSLPNVTENGVAGIPIRDIRVGQRVLAHNPEVSDTERESWGEEPDFGRWLHLKLEMPKEDGGILHIEILRPEEWVESQLGYVVAEAEESRRHALRDQAKRDKTSASEDNRCEEKTSHATLPDQSVLTAISNVKDSGVPAMPHHAERDGDVSGTERQTSSVDEFPLPLVPLSPLRPIYFNLAMRSAAIGAAGAELVGLTVEMDLPEMGASGTAIITEILPASQIEPRMSSDDDRQVVTATFRHPPSNQILEVAFVSESDWQRRQPADPNAPDLKPETQNLNPGSEADTISVTDNHLFWSVDQQEFVEVGQMRIGERVQTFHGETKRLASKLPRPGPPEEVYNLEVYGEHVYFVGGNLLLAHNDCLAGKVANRTATRAEWKAHSRIQRRAIRDQRGGAGIGRGGHQTVDRIAGEIDGAVQQAGRILAAGGTRNTYWGRRFQDALQGGDDLPLAVIEGNARQQIADRLLENNSYFAEAGVISNRGHALGLRNARGNLFRPDYQVPLDDFGQRYGILDLTTETAGAKIWKYHVDQTQTPILYNIYWR